MKDFDHYFNKMTKGIEDHEFRHFNRAMGIMIYSKEHYKKELLRRRMLPDDMLEDARDEYFKKNKRKGYDLSPKAREILSHLESLKGRNKGMIKLCEYPKLVEVMKEIGLDYTRDYSEMIK